MRRPKPPRSFNRRHFVGGLAATFGALGLPGLERALAQTPTDQRFVFVFATGGWDPLAVFAPQFGSASIDMEAGTGTETIGNIELVASPNRPRVQQFFQRWGEQTLVLNGINVRSVSHEVCTRLMLTGINGEGRPDWATQIAAARAGDFAVPHLVLGGASSPGNLSSVVVESGASGQLQLLLEGEVLEWLDQWSLPLDREVDRLVDDFLKTRANQAAAGAGPASPAGSMEPALARAGQLKDLDIALAGEDDYELAAQIDRSVGLLAADVCRCITVSGGGGWDTHNNNVEQTDLFESLFSGLDLLMASLHNTNGSDGVPISSKTTVVVLSEMGRTPKFNGTRGRDHWPYTSAMLIGPRVTGNRVVGAYDDLFVGRNVDLATGELTESGRAVSVEVFGATLLRLAEVDLPVHLQGVPSLDGILA